MSDKYFIANGNMVIGNMHNTDIFAPIVGTIDSAARFKKTEGERFISEKLDGDMSWVLFQTTKRSSGTQRYIITTASNFIGNNGIVRTLKNAKGFRSVADAESFIRSRKDIMKNFGTPYIVNDNLETFERNARKEFTDEQLNFLGFTKKANRINFTPARKNSLYLASEKRCAICGKTLSESEMTVDHIVPISRGGKNVTTNLRCVCKDCNQLKYNLLDSEMYESMSNIISAEAYRNPDSDNWKKIIRSIVRGTISGMSSPGRDAIVTN